MPTLAFTLGECRYDGFDGDLLLLLSIRRSGLELAAAAVAAEDDMGLPVGRGKRSTPELGL